MVVLGVPHAVIVNDRATIAIHRSGAPINRAVIGENTATDTLLEGGVVNGQHTVAAQGDHRVVPLPVLPVQTAVDDIRPDQITAAKEHVGTGERSIDIEIAAAQIGDAIEIGGDVAPGETASANQGQLQTVGAALNVQHASQLVEDRATVEIRAGIAANPARLAERAKIVEYCAVAAPVEIMVVLRVPHAVIVNDRATIAIHRSGAPINRAVIGENTAINTLAEGGVVEGQHTVAAQGDHRVVPLPVLPVQTAVDDIRPDQITAAKEHVGASERSIDIKIVAAQVGNAIEIGGNVASGEAAAAG